MFSGLRGRCDVALELNRGDRAETSAAGGADGATQHDHRSRVDGIEDIAELATLTADRLSGRDDVEGRAFADGRDVDYRDELAAVAAAFADGVDRCMAHGNPFRVDCASG